MPPSPTDQSRTRRLALLLLVGGAVGFLAAADLLIEKIEMLRDPFYVPSCTISAVVSCGSVMSSGAAEMFGFPNPIIGVAAFPAVITTGAVLLAGAALPRWYWLGLQAGVAFGIVFVHVLVFETLYRIGALCPYCTVVWAVTIPIFLFVTMRNVTSGDLPVPGVLARPLHAIDRHRGVVLAVWYLVIGGLVAQRFWDDWLSIAP